MLGLALKSKITYGISLLLLLLLATLAFFTLRFFAGEFQRSISMQQFALVSVLAGELDDKLATAQGELSSVAATLDPTLFGDPQRAQRLLESRLDTRLMFDNGVLCFAADGRLIAISPQNPNLLGRNFSSREYFRNTVSSGQPRISEPFPSIRAGAHPIIMLTAPVFAADGSLAGILAGSLDLLKDNVLGALAEVRLGEKGYLTLFGKDRRLIVHPERSRILQEALPAGANRLLDQAVGGFEGSAETVDAQGHAIFSSMKRLRTTGWILAANFPVAEAFAPLRQATSYFFIALAASLLVCLLLLRQGMGRLLAPLSALATRVRNRTADLEETRMPALAPRDEVGALAQAFEHLLASVDRHGRSLEEQSRFSQVLLDSLPVPVFYKDTQGRYLGCNQTFTTCFGLSRAQLIGKTVFDIADATLARTYQEADRQLLGQGAGAVQVYEEMLAFADGSQHEAVFYKAIFPAADGSPAGLVGTWMDITARKQAEAAFMEARAFSEQLLQGSAVATFVVDVDHRVVLWNRACEQLTGIPAQEMIGKAEAWRGFYPRQRPVLADLVLEGPGAETLYGNYETFRQSPLLAAGLQTEGWFENLGGRDRYILFEAAPIHNAGGEVVAVIETIHDRTEQKKSEEALAEIDTSLSTVSGSDFFQVLAHYLAETLRVDMVLIGELDRTVVDVVQTLAVVQGDALQDPFLLPLSEAPWTNLLAGQRCVHPGGVAGLFPDNPFFAQHGIESCVALLLVGSTGDPLGMLAIFHRRPLENVSLVESLVRIFASRAGAELERKQAQESLERSLSLVQATLEATADGLLVVNSAGTIITYNRKFAKLWSLSPELLEQRENALVLAAILEQLQEPQAFMNRAMELINHPDQEGLDILLCKDGRVFERYSQPQRIADAIVGRVWSFRDVTAARRAENELRKLSHATEQSPVSVMITNAAGVIEYVNERFVSLTGYGAAEVLGKNPRMLQSGEHDPEFYRGLWQTIKAGHLWQGELLNRKKDGSLYWEAASISPIKNPQGEITHFVALKEDVSERRKVEDSERRSRALNEALGEASLAFLHHGDLNQMAAILVDRSVAITGAAYGLLFDLAEDGAARVLAVRGSLQRPEPCPESCFCRQLEEDIRQEGFAPLPPELDLFLAPVREARAVLQNQLALDAWFQDNLPLSSFLGVPLPVAEAVVGAIVLLNAPSGFSEREREELEAFARTASLALQSARRELAREEAEEHLRQVQKMEAIGQLAGGVAHDFNNLLTVINGYGALLLESLGDDAKSRQDVELILQAGTRAADLTRQLLAFSRRQILEPRVLELNMLIRNLGKMLSRLIPENIAIELTLAPKPASIKADPGQLEQILINLAVNARDAMPEGGTIRIATAQRDLDEEFVRSHEGAVAGPYVMVTFGDTGCGMSKEVREHIFEPFFTTKAMGQGTGLGLSTVYGIVKQSGGYIEVESRTGQGTTFVVYLPRVEAVDPAEPAPMVSLRPEGGSGTILLVEDEPGVLTLIDEVLRDQGYTVLATSLPEEALELYAAHRDEIDLLISDMVMPGLSGPDLVFRLLQQQPELKVLLMSGYAEDGLVEGGLPGGAAFLQKPFSVMGLLEKVDKVLRSPAEPS